MKFRTLLFVLSAASLAACAYIALPQPVKVSDYSPRNAQQFTSHAASYLDAVPYYKLLRGNMETGEFEPQDWITTNNAVAEYDRSTAGMRDQELAWHEMGPDNVGGRTRAILALDDNSTVFAGSVSGGLWKSTNAANTWSKVESFPSCPIGSIDQTGNGYIYVGTGCVFESGTSGDGGSGFIGNGLYYSMDGGTSWQIVPGTETSPLNTGDDWIFFNELAADPNNPNRIWFAAKAGVGYWEPGMSEPEMNLSGLTTSQGQDIVWAPDGSYLLVGAGSAKLYRSSDGGNSFSLVSGAIPNSSGRIRIAISPVDPNYCYVAYSTNGGSMGGAYVSSDAGLTWTLIWPAENDAPQYDPFGDNNQGYYDLALVANPFNAGLCMLGGVTLWKAGAITQPEEIGAFVHVDHHTFEMAPDGTVYLGNDGGIYKTLDGGVNWIACNKNYNVTQYYGIAHSSGYPVIGGAQDNGTTIIPGLSNPFVPVITDQQAIAIYSGDGFDCELSQVSTGQIAAFVCSQFGNIGRFDQNGSGGPFYDNDILNLIDPNVGEIGPFYTVFRLFEDTEDQDSQQYVILVNNEDYDITDTTLTLLTKNLGIPFSYTLEDGDVLHFWEELIRPEVTTTEPILVDPDYFWLDPQPLLGTSEECDTIQVGTETVIDQITPITQTIYWEDSLFYNDEWIYIMDSTIVVLDYDTTYEEVPVYEIDNCITYYHYGADTLENVHERRLVLDTYTSMFVTGFYGSDGIWLTREALNLNTTPDWWKLGNAPSTGIRTFEFSADGDHLFYSSWGGQLVRVSGLDDLWSEDDVDNLSITTLIPNAGGVVTSIASDPNDPNHMVITIGGYGSSTAGKVRETFNALAATPTWSSIWQFSQPEMSRMPCYASVINVMDDSGASIAVGTEFGVFYTDNGGDTWTHCLAAAPGSIGTVGNCPVFELRQQIIDGKRFMDSDNWGSIYAGSHGRGIFRSDDFLSNSITESDPTPATIQLLVYPNPTASEAYLNLELGSASKVVVNVYNVQGTLVRTIDKGRMTTGEHKISLEAEYLAKGNYIVHVNAGTASGVSKFVKL